MARQMIDNLELAGYIPIPPIGSAKAEPPLMPTRLVTTYESCAKSVDKVIDQAAG